MTFLSVLVVIRCMWQSHACPSLQMLPNNHIILHACQSESTARGSISLALVPVVVLYITAPCCQCSDQLCTANLRVTGLPFSGTSMLTVSAVFSALAAPFTTSALDSSLTGSVLDPSPWEWDPPPPCEWPAQDETAPPWDKAFQFDENTMSTKTYIHHDKGSTCNVRWKCTMHLC